MRLITHNSKFIFDFPIQVNLKYRIKKMLAPFFDLFYSLVIWSNRPKETSPKTYRLVACAIFKDEALYIKEWIEHNRLVGIEHFFLYNNFSTDHYQEILKPYIKDDIVTLIDWPVDKGQFPAYEHFWINYRQCSQWVTFIDLDEFFCPYYDLNISDWLDKYKNYPSVIVYWKMFGTSGKVYHDPLQLVTQQYTICWDRMDSIGKVIINTNWEFTEIYHHTINAKCVFFGRIVTVPSIDEFGHFMKWSIDRYIPENKDFTIQLNHYWSKSYESYRVGKIERGDVNNHIRNYDLFFLHERNNRSVDYKIYRFLVDLKLKMDNNE